MLSLITIALTGCGSGNSADMNNPIAANPAAALNDGNPENVAQAYIFAEVNHDCQLMMELWSTKIINKDQDKFIKQCQEQMKNVQKVDTANLRVKDSRLSGDKATVNLSGVVLVEGDKTEKGDDEIRLVKENGLWKIEEIGVSSGNN